MSPMESLTKRQKAVFEFIREKITGRGYGPTVREIGEQFKISSPNGVMCHLKALEKLKANAAKEDEKARLDWALERVEAGSRPLGLSERDLERCAGTYGSRRVWAEGGQLRYGGEEIPTFLLAPLAPGVFVAEADDSLRLEFVPDAGGRVERLIVTTLDGQRWEYTRDR